MAVDPSAGEPIKAEEVEAVLSTRGELGSSWEPELAASFADRIERLVEARVSERSQEIARRRSDDAGQGGRQMVLGIVSLGTGIPITAIAATQADLPGVLVAWAGIVGVNVAHAAVGRRR